MRVFLFFHQSRHVAMEFRGDSRKYGDSNEFVLEKEDIASHFSEKDIFLSTAYVVAISRKFPRFSPLDSRDSNSLNECSLSFIS